ncbi:hypothetical protein GCM10007358_09940 [Phocicoccus schoeneichii]|uniref:Uncharacterized protein n=1 Tax=Phocicoccus schoeneichii TaxID=1812261 RepID=A0A6V7RPY0_9BACL|nr:hypothetical protein [Jeotgalicoccus schoeneichii]GGH51996.1 hypothetical protein GCM10007358_09940 [Jeotgalicoccus schoeneichii]CAD2080373.1 hypothetical protein JEOSCH030_01820 [Jeotgalicoccus schoeneichii]
MNISKSEIKAVVTNLFDNALEGTNTHQIIGNVDIEVLPKSSKDRVDVFIAKADEGTTNFYDRPQDALLARMEYLGSEKRYNEAVERATEVI